MSIKLHITKEQWDMKKEDITTKLVEEMSNHRVTILDNFMKAYLASRWDDYFSKQEKIDFKRLELVEQRKSATESIYFFRLKKGRLKKRV